MRRGWWLVVGLVGVMGAVLHHNLLFLTSLLLALVGGTSLLWTHYCLAGVSYGRRFGSTHLFHGDETDLCIEIVNAKPLPLAWLRAIDDFPADVELMKGELYHSPAPRRRLLVNVLSLRWYERVTRRYRLRGVRRGAWQFGPVWIASGDIFGFSVERKALEGTHTVVVYPKIVSLTTLGLPKWHPFGDSRTPRRAVTDPLRLMGAREYLPGDSFRHIHWKATAHRRILQTKVFEPSASQPLAIFLNIRTSESITEGLDRVLQDFAITAVASIARWAWEERHPVGLFANSTVERGGERIRIQPSSHPDQFQQILEALARVEPFGPWTLAKVLQVEATTLRYGTTLIVVTPIINERLRRTLMELHRREYGVALVALGQARLEAPLPGLQYYHIGGREEWYELESLALA
jgi:uncharacterized protein (DUF58 family)